MRTKQQIQNLLHHSPAACLASHACRLPLPGRPPPPQQNATCSACQCSFWHAFEQYHAALQSWHRSANSGRAPHAAHALPRKPRRARRRWWWRWRLRRRPSAAAAVARAAVVAFCSGVGPLVFSVAGGGYFRLYPAWFSIACLKRINLRQGQPFMFYIHPWELDPDQPRLPGKLRSRFRHYQNLSSTERKLDRLLDSFTFGSMTEALSQCPKWLSGSPESTQPQTV